MEPLTDTVDIISNPSNDTEVVDEYFKMFRCPFPDPSVIFPCRCYGDDSYRIHLICHLQSDLEANLLSSISRSFSCRQIHHLEFDLGGHKWLAGFSGEHFGNLEIEKVIIRNASSIQGEWFTGGVFNSSVSTLKEFVVEPSQSNGQVTVSSGAFKGLSKLSVLKLGDFI